MRVLVISPTFPPIHSGGADHAFRMCQYLAGREIEIHVLTSCIENVATDPSLRIYPVMRTWSWAEMPRLLRIARRYRPDVLNIHFSGGIYADQPMVTFAPTFMKKALPGLRVVTQIEYPEPVSVHRLSFQARGGRKLAARLAGTRDVDYGYGTILRDSDRIILLSDAYRPMLSPHYSGIDDKCVLIPPPPLMRMCAKPADWARRQGREKLGVGPDEFLVAYFGYIYPGKGIETLLRGFQSVVKQKGKVRLVVVGGSNEIVLKRLGRNNYARELQGLAREIGLDGKVSWTGYYPAESDLGSIYLRAADACVLPFDDGVLLHRSSFAAAAVHGLPIITTRGDTLEPPFVDGRNVLLCTPQDPTSLAGALTSLIERPELRRNLSAGVLSMAREWFSWDRAIERLMEAFGSRA